MKRQKQNKLLLVIAIASFIIAIWEGYYFYAKYSAFPFWQFLLVMQNGITTFFFMPKISLETILGIINEGGLSAMQTIVAHTYMVVIFLAPLCTVTTILKVLNVLLHLRNRIQRWSAKEQYVIFGYNEDVEVLLQNSMKGAKEDRVVHLVTDKEFSKNEELALMKCRTVVYRDNVLSYKDTDQKKIQKFFQKIQSNKVKHIYLMEHAADNFSLYILLTENKALLREDCIIHCSCENEEIRKLLINYHDEQEDKLDLTVFDAARLQIGSMFKEHPVYEYNLRKKLKNLNAGMDVHMLLVGFGRIGKQVLNAALNNSVLSSDSHIIIDIMDKNSKNLEKILANAYRSEQVYIDENSIKISGHVADGLLEIRFHQVDVFEQRFPLLLKELSEELPFTYGAICTKEADVSIHALLEIEKHLKLKEDTMPIALRMEMGSQLLEYLNGNRTIYRNVFSITAKSRVLTFEKLGSDKDTAEAVAFNAKYNEIALMETGDEKSVLDKKQTPEEMWNALSFLKKESNRYLNYHSDAKQMLCICKAYEDGVVSKEEFAAYAESTIRGGLAQKSIQYVMERYFVGKEGFLTKEGNVYRFDSERNVEQINSIPFVKEMAMLEHRRWCYFMLKSGWSCPPVNHGKTKAQLEAIDQNVCIINWQLLCERVPYVCIYDLMPFLIL